MHFAAIVFGCLLAAPADDEVKGQAPGAIAESPRQLRNKVHDALRSHALANKRAQGAAVRKLAALYDVLETDTLLPEAERRQLRGTIRARLVRTGEALQKELVRPDRSPLRGNNVLAQQPAAAGNPPQQPAGRDEAEGLIELIQNTIAPNAWEANGGSGTIRYFDLKQLLVVSQTQDIHEQIDEVLEQLRD